MSGMLSLKWNNHIPAFLKSLDKCHNKELYCDATILTCGKYYPVHRFVLSTCSEYFEEVFAQAHCKHPFIIIKDIEPNEIEALLSYMYRGEANVTQDDLPKFVRAAEILKIKGLAVPDGEPENNHNTYGIPAIPSPINIGSDKKETMKISNTSERNFENMADKSVFENCEETNLDKSEGNNFGNSIQMNGAVDTLDDLNCGGSAKSSQRDISNVNNENFLDILVNDGMDNKDTQKTSEVEDGETEGLNMKIETVMGKEDLPNDCLAPEVKGEQPEPFLLEITPEFILPEVPPMLKMEQEETSLAMDFDASLEPGPSTSEFPSFIQSDPAVGSIVPSEEFSKKYRYYCAECNFKGKDKSAYKLHIMRRHTGEKPFSCSFCDYSCTTKDILKIHIRKHTGERPFSCPYCSCRTTVKSSLKRHIFQKHIRNMKDSSPTADAEVKSDPVKTFKCSECPYESPMKCNVNLHFMRMHTSEKPFGCSFCSYRTTTKPQLVKHVRNRHTLERPFECSFCPYKASEKQRLLKHMAVHMNSSSRELMSS